METLSSILIGQTICVLVGLACQIFLPGSYDPIEIENDASLPYSLIPSSLAILPMTLLHGRSVAERTVLGVCMCSDELVSSPSPISATMDEKRTRQLADPVI